MIVSKFSLKRTVLFLVPSKHVAIEAIAIIFLLHFYSHRWICYKHRIPYYMKSVTSIWSIIWIQSRIRGKPPCFNDCLLVYTWVTGRISCFKVCIQLSNKSYEEYGYHTLSYPGPCLSKETYTSLVLFFLSDRVIVLLVLLLLFLLVLCTGLSLFITELRALFLFSSFLHWFLKFSL